MPTDPTAVLLHVDTRTLGHGRAWAHLPRTRPQGAGRRHRTLGAERRPAPPTAGEQNGALYLVNAYIPEYQLAGQYYQHETKRPRKLLVHKREMNRLMGAIKREGVTIIPLWIYFNERGVAKVELGVGRGKKKGDKRAAEKDRDWQRDKARVIRSKGKDFD